jgi:hypothetical protein
MRVLDGGEIWEDELADLGFEAEGELETVLNVAYARLGEFAHSRDARRIDPDLDRRMREDLQVCLDDIVKTWERQDGSGRGD